MQELSSHVGLNVAQASSDSIGAREIQDLIDKDVPQVWRVSYHMYMYMHMHLHVWIVVVSGLNMYIIQDYM